MSKTRSSQLNWILSQKYWELYEAFFILIGWPKNMVTRSLSSEIQGRNEIYIPETKFSQKSFKKTELKILSHLKMAATSREMFTFPEITGLEKIYGENQSYFLSAENVIQWALRKGVIFPMEIQNEFGFYQLESQPSKPLQRSVKNRIVGQMIHYHQPKLSLDEIRDHNLMRKFGSHSMDNTHREIYRDLLNVFEIESGKAGVKTFITNPLKPMGEVLLRDVEGKNRYSFLLLEIVLSTAAKIKIDIVGVQTISMMTDKEVMDFFLNDFVIRLYINGANENIIKLTSSFFLQEIKSCYFGFRYNNLPNDKKNKPLTIGETFKLSWENRFNYLKGKEEGSILLRTVLQNSKFSFLSQFLTCM